MSFNQKTKLMGLVTNASRQLAPPGSLEVANNVVIRKPGVVEPRPGLSAVTGTPSGIPRKVWDYKGYVHSYQSGHVIERALDSQALDIDDVTGNAIGAYYPFREDLMAVCQARGNLYVGAREGVRKIANTTDTEMMYVGAPFVYAVYVGSSTAGTPTALATGYKFGYRLVGYRNIDGFVTRSVPSAAYVIENTSGSTINATVYIGTPPSWQGTYDTQSYDKVEIYRTRAVTTSSTLDEEYALVGVVNAPGATAYLVDTLTDAQRGAALYTSPSQGGATNENQRPPSCGCMELFKGHLFFGNTIGPFRYTVSASVSTSADLGTGTGIGQRDRSADITSGLATITNISPDTTNLEVGMVLSCPNAAVSGYAFPSDTYIVSIDSATQVTMNRNATETAVGRSMTFVDAIYLGSNWYPVWPGKYDAVGVSVLNTPIVAGISSIQRANSTIATATTASTVYYARAISPSSNPAYTATYIIEEIVNSSATATTPTLKATHGSLYSTDISSPVSMSRDVLPNGLYWSKRDEPEHVAPINFALVGDSAKAILGLVALRDAMLILKEDGIWRLSGTGGNTASAWRIDPLDMTTFCVLPQSIQKMNDMAYFLSNKGFVRVSSSGVEVISNVIADEARRLVLAAQSVYATAGYYALVNYSTTDSPRWASAVNETESEYIVSIGNYADTLSDVLVYNEATGAWTTWSLASSGAYSCGRTYPEAMAWCPSERSVVMGMLTVPRLRKLTITGTDSPVVSGYDARSDGYTAITINSVSGSSNSYTVTLSSALTLLVGHLIVVGGYVYEITSITSTTVVVVTQRLIGDATPTAPVTGAGFAVGTFTSTVRTRPFIQPGGIQKLWSFLTAGFAELVGPTALLLTSLSNASQSSVDATAQVTERAKVPMYRGRAAVYRGNDFKMNVPRAHARARDLWAGVQILNGMGTWELDSFTAGALDSEPNKPAHLQTGAA